jgi:hypothetical protein
MQGLMKEAGSRQLAVGNLSIDPSTNFTNFTS